MKMNNVCLAMLVLILVGISACKTANSKFKFGFQDTGMPIDQRVDDLVSRLTLDQKIEQLMNQAPGIDSLGIPQYNWWSEGLHGIARAGLATVFPQAIGMAATWDDALIYEVANVISDETRAKHEEFVRRGKKISLPGIDFVVAQYQYIS